MFLLKKAIKPVVAHTEPSTKSVEYRSIKWVLSAFDKGLTDNLVMHGLDRLFAIKGERASRILEAGKALLNTILAKSHISAYDRISVSGTLQHVREHADSRHKRDLKPGQLVYFKTPDGRKVRQGTLLEPLDGGWRIQGKREAGKFKAPVHHAPFGDILTVEEQAAKYSTGSAIREGGRISIAENNRRAEAGFPRLGLSEKAVLTSPAIENIQTATLKKLAVQNRIRPYQDGIADDDYSEMWACYVSDMITSLRHEVSNAPLADLREFKDFILEKRSECRIAVSITTAGKNAAMDFVKQRVKDSHDFIEYPADENDPAFRRNARTVPPEHESESTRVTVRNKLIDQFVSKLPPIEAEIIQRKYGIGSEHDIPQSDEHIAQVLNAAGLMIRVKAGQKHPHTGQVHPKDGVVKWTRNHVGTAHKAAIENLKGIRGTNVLRQFFKAAIEVVTLKKSVINDLDELRILAEGMCLQRKLRIRIAGK